MLDEETTSSSSRVPLGSFSRCHIGHGASGSKIHASHAPEKLPLLRILSHQHCPMKHGERGKSTESTVAESTLYMDKVLSTLIIAKASMTLAGVVRLSRMCTMVGKEGRPRWVAQYLPTYF